MRAQATVRRADDRFAGHDLGDRLEPVGYEDWIPDDRGPAQNVQDSG